jgi:hypothetical protein
VHDHFEAKHALAFGINLQSQLAAVQPEYRQIIRRFLDSYFLLRGLVFGSDISGSGGDPGWF